MRANLHARLPVSLFWLALQAVGSLLLLAGALAGAEWIAAYLERVSR